MLPLTIVPRALKRCEETYNRWVITAMPLIDRKDVFRESYWYHVLDRLRVGDIVEIRASDYSWYYELLLVENKDRRARWQTLIERDFNSGAKVEIDEEVDGLKIEVYGRDNRFRIVDVTTTPPHSLTTGLLSKLEAHQARAKLLESR